MQEIRTYFNKFIRLDDDEWNAFEQCIELREVKKGSFLLEEGAECDFLAFIKDGLFRFYYLKKGDEKITAFFFGGEFVSNYRSFLTGKPSEHYIQSMKDSMVYIIKKNNLLDMYDRFKNLERLGRFIAENLYLSVAYRLDSFMFATPAERYADLVNRNSKLLNEIPQYMVASYLGVKPETLSRIRARK